MSILLCLLMQADIFTATVKPAASPLTLTVYHAPWCGSCVNWERTEQPKLIAAGVVVTRIDIDADKSTGVSRIPAFHVMQDGKVISTASGYTSAASLLTLLKVRQQVPAPEQKQGESLVGTSHESRETLIAHLMGDGIHKGRHTAASLQAMTFQQLSDLHDRDHSQPRYAVQTQSVRPVKRRGGIFGWRRR